MRKIAAVRSISKIGADSLFEASKYNAYFSYVDTPGGGRIFGVEVRRKASPDRIFFIPKEQIAHIEYRESEEEAGASS
jgi:hypothetical protein